MNTEDALRDADMAAFDRELTMARGAIRMVADGAYPSMTLGGLGHGQAVMEALELEAERSSVELVPLARGDGAGLDLRVRRPVVTQPGAAR